MAAIPVHVRYGHRRRGSPARVIGHNRRKRQRLPEDEGQGKHLSNLQNHSQFEKILRVHSNKLRPKTWWITDYGPNPSLDGVRRHHSGCSSKASSSGMPTCSTSTTLYRGRHSQFASLCLCCRLFSGERRYCPAGISDLYGGNINSRQQACQAGCKIWMPLRGNLTGKV